MLMHGMMQYLSIHTVPHLSFPGGIGEVALFLTIVSGLIFLSWFIQEEAKQQ